MTDPRSPQGPYDGLDDHGARAPHDDAPYDDRPHDDAAWDDQGGWDDEHWPDDDDVDAHTSEYVAVRADRPGRRRWLVATLVLLGLVVVLALGTAWWVRGQIDPGNPGDDVALTIPSGATTSDIANLLTDKGVIGNPTVFQWYLRFSGGGPFKAGDYQGLRQNQAMGDVVDILDRGPAPPPVVTVTFREGLWLAETRQKILDTFPEMDPAALDAALAAVQSPILPQGTTNPEGVLFPATYEIPKAKSNDPNVILGEMVQAFQRAAQAQGLADATAKLQGVAGKRQITPYEALIVASMVEAEARTDADRPKIARVIYNRIAQGMRLDIDATVLYALQDRKAPLTQSQLRTDSPYNTRLKSGMPPTPINSPGEASIQAALNPAPGNWLYYVLADEQGNHYFTDNANDFNRAVADARSKGLL